MKKTSGKIVSQILILIINKKMRIGTQRRLGNIESAIKKINPKKLRNPELILRWLNVLYYAIEKQEEEYQAF